MTVHTHAHLDERDTEILEQRVNRLNAEPGIRVGDFVRFADGVLRRVSYVWRGQTDRIQTATSGSFYLGDGFVEMSGGHFLSVPATTLELTDEVWPGAVWFFHHHHRRAHNGTDATIDFRVFTCGLPAPS
jgi:hypothetical protein